jgi:glycosyltransferase involved in cell wall biosynthesis
VKISVIIPVYNGERHLRAALESVFAQTYPLHEIITVDDGSTDSSPEILRSFGDRLTVIRQENQGVAGARNTGLAHATGEAIAFLDQDDLWPADRTQVLVDALQADGNAEIAVGVVEVRHDPESPPLHQWELTPLHREFLLGSQLIRTQLFSMLGKLNTNVGYGDDTDFWVRVREHDVQLAKVNEVTLTYRQHAKNTSFDVNVSKFNTLSVMREHLKRQRAGRTSGSR